MINMTIYLKNILIFQFATLNYQGVYQPTDKEDNSSWDNSLSPFP